MKSLLPIALAALLAAGGCTGLKDVSDVSMAPMQKPHRFEKKLTHTARLDYLLFLPEGYSATGGKGWPLMLFLHGAGERGTNLQSVMVHGPPKLVRTQPDFPFVLVSPQCPFNRAWRDDELLALLDAITAKHNIDTNRIYVTGLSMGGYGSWSLGSKYPERFAAIAPICGGGEQIAILLASREKKAAMKAMGIWAFHGAKDPVVPLEESQRMTNAFMRAGCQDVKLTVYPEAGHDSWTQAYAEPGIWSWFLAHSRAK